MDEGSPDERTPDQEPVIGSDQTSDESAQKSGTHRLIIGFVVVAIIIVGVFLMLRKTEAPTETPSTTETEVEEVNTEIAESLDQVPANPVDEAPDLNPTQNTNPFEDPYKNPFE